MSGTLVALETSTIIGGATPRTLSKTARRLPSGENAARATSRPMVTPLTSRRSPDATSMRVSAQVARSSQTTAAIVLDDAARGSPTPSGRGSCSASTTYIEPCRPTSKPPSTAPAAYVPTGNGKGGTVTVPLNAISLAVVSGSLVITQARPGCAEASTVELRKSPSSRGSPSKGAVK